MAAELVDRSELISVHQRLKFAYVAGLKIDDPEKVDELLHVKKETRKKLTRLVTGMRKLVSLNEIKFDMFEHYEHAREVEASIVFLITEENGDEHEESNNLHLDHDFYLVNDDTDNLFGSANRYAIKTPAGRLILDVHAPKNENEVDWAIDKLETLATGKIPEGIFKELL